MKKDGNLNSKKTVHHDFANMMNSRLDIILWGVPADQAGHISREIISAGRNLQSVLDRFDPKAETSIVNHQAHHRDTPVSSLMMSVLSQSIHYHLITQGIFNVFAGDAFDALKKGHVAGKTFPINDPRDTVIINKEKQTVRFTTKNVSLDFGGIGKGLVLDKAAEILTPHPSINAFISFGGSSVLTRGHHPYGESWPFSFRVPEINETWYLTNDTLSISQNKTDNRRKPHILNTFEENKGALNRNRLACVQSNIATDAEVLSTALLAGPDNMQEQIVTAFNIKRHRIYNLIP